MKLLNKLSTNNTHKVPKLPNMRKQRQPISHVRVEVGNTCHAFRPEALEVEVPGEL
jgi:hypothetical protein